MSDIKITKERIDALLSEADIRTLTLFGKCTVVTAKMKNGFVLTADSACVDPANYDKRTGERICLEQRLPKIADRSQCNHAWVLERTDGCVRHYYCEKCGAHHKQVVPQQAAPQRGDTEWK